MMPNRRPLAIGPRAVLGAAAVLAGVACSRSGVSGAPADTAAAPSTPTYVVHDTMITDAFPAYGVASPIDRATVATRLAGTVIDVLVREGDRVSAGQPMVRIDARDLDARGEQARAAQDAADATYRDAEANAARMRALFADSAAPRAQLDAAEAALARATASVQAAQAGRAEVDASRAYAVLRAPFAGVVTQRLVDPGAFAAPGTPLITVEATHRLRIVVTAPAAAIRALRRGDSLDAIIEHTPARAVVEGVVPAPGGGAYTVNALVDNTAHTFLASGAATLLLPGAPRHALFVPAAAVVSEGDLTGVRVVAGAGPALRWIRLRPAADGRIEVLTGLSAGDTVLLGEPTTGRAR